MAQVLIRNLDDKVIARLKVRAELKGHSLEQELRDIINRSAPLSPQERVAISNRIAGMQKKPASVPSEVLIRRIRDRDSA